MSLIAAIPADFLLFDGVTENGVYYSVKTDDTYDLPIAGITYLTTRGTVRSDQDASYAGASRDSMIVHFNVSDLGGTEAKARDRFRDADGVFWEVWVVEKIMRDTRYRLHCLKVVGS